MIAHNSPSLGEAETHAAARALHSGWVARGKETEAFEHEIAAFLEIPNENVVVTSSGTSALYLALWALDAARTTVAMPGYVCSALRHAVSMAGANARFVDNAADSPNVDCDELLCVKPDIAIIPYMYGIPIDISRVAAQVPVIEDCAQAFGARRNGRPVGLDGRVGIASFYATKLLTSGGQGGAVFSRDRTIVDRIRDYLDFDCRRDGNVRFNFQITDIQSAIGRAQLARYDGFITRRRDIFERYRACGLTLLDASDAALEPVRYRAVALSENPRRLIAHFEEREIRAIVPTEEWELPSGADLPNARALTTQTVSLPLYPAMTNDDVDRIISALHEFAA